MSKYFAKTTTNGWRRQRVLSSAADMGLQGAPELGGDFEAKRTKGIRQQSLATDFWPQFSQALGISFWVCVVGLAAWLLFGWLDWRIAVFISILAGALWYIAGLQFSRKLLFQVEEIVSHDINGDGEIGEPEVRELGPAEVITRDERGQMGTMYRLDLGSIPDHKLTAFGRGAEQSLAEASWTGGAGIFSKSEYKRLIDELRRAELIEFKSAGSPNQGYKLTEAGRQAMAQWAQNRLE